MFYVLILPSLALSVWTLLKLRNLKKHDIVLFRFCQIRRDIMKLIDTRGVNLDRTGYHSVRNMLECLNSMTHNYEGFKVHIFNVRRLERILKSYKHATRQIDKIQVPSDAEIVELHKKFRYAMLEAFLVYTPLIRSEIMARLLLKLLMLLSHAGIKSLARFGNYLAWLIDEMAEINSHNHPLSV